VSDVISGASQFAASKRGILKPSSLDKFIKAKQFSYNTFSSASSRNPVFIISPRSLFALSKLLSLNGVTFKSNKLAEKYGYMNKSEQVGVIAQEVEKVLPQIVVPAPFDIAQDKDGNEYSKSGENYKTVHYEKLIPLLIESIKEQNETIENLKIEIEKLKSKVDGE